MPETKWYGCIDEDTFQLRSPRDIDGDEHDTIAGAVEEAMGMILGSGVEQIAIVRCRYSEKQQSWVEIVGAGCIEIDARNWNQEEETDDPMVG